MIAEKLFNRFDDIQRLKQTIKKTLETFQNAIEHITIWLI